MKFKLCVTLVLLIAVSNVFGDEQRGGRPNRPNGTSSRRLSATSDGDSLRPKPSQDETGISPSLSSGSDSGRRPSDKEDHFPSSSFDDESRPRPTDIGDRFTPSSDSVSQPHSSDKEDRFPESSSDSVSRPRPSDKEDRFPGSSSDRLPRPKPLDKEDRFPGSSSESVSRPRPSDKEGRFPGSSSDRLPRPKPSDKEDRFPGSSSESVSRPRPSDKEDRFPESSSDRLSRPLDKEDRFPESSSDRLSRPLDKEDRFPGSSSDRLPRPKPSDKEDRFPTSSSDTDFPRRPLTDSSRDEPLKTFSQKGSSFEEEHSKFDASNSKASSSKEKVEIEENKNDRFGGESSRVSKLKEETSVSESKVSSENKSTKVSSFSNEEQNREGRPDRFGLDTDRRRPTNDNPRFPSTGSQDESSFEGQPPRKNFGDSIKKPSKDNFETSPSRDTRPLVIAVPPSSRPSDYEVLLENRVHVTGSIRLARNQQKLVDSVDYGLKDGRWNKQRFDATKSVFNDDSNTIDRNSQVILYVSTLNSFNVREAFTNFTLPFTGKSFPFDFDVEIILPNTLLRLLKTEDLKLYFYAYVYNSEPVFESFIPDGTSQILLQGTNRLVQRVDVFVRANGLQLNGVFQGFYGEKFIKPGTSFQILIISEEFIHRFSASKVDYVAQIIVTDVPSMYPLTFNGLVPFRRLNSGVRYYAIAYIFEDGFERLITPVPILVINENRVVVTTDLSIKVTPFPFMIYGTITRLMPGNYYFESGSSIILNFYQVDAQLPPIVFRLPSIEKLPQDFQLNLSQAIKFDPTKKYEVLASVADAKNEIYMTSSQRLLLDVTSSRFTIPVEDLYYHVRVNFRSSFNQQLTFIRESIATIIVTETPEATRAPLFRVQFDPTDLKADGYLLKMPIRSVSRVSSAYMILLVNNTGIITHVSKVLFISNNQPPALNLDVPVIPLNLLRGQIVDYENNAPQWSSWSYANIYLLDDAIEDRQRAVVQTWKIYLEREFPVNFEVRLDFSRLVAGHTYSLASNIETRPGFPEYKSANVIRVIEPERPIQDNLRLMVKSVKVSHIINGMVYLDGVQEYLSKRGEVVVYLSSNQILTKPDILFETRMRIDSRVNTVNFKMEIPLDRIDMNGIYYFLIQYVSGGEVVIAPLQVFSYTPRNGATVILRLSKSEQIQVTGQVVSTGGPLVLPEGSRLLLQITDTQFGANPKIYSETLLPATTTNIYRFTLYFDAIMVPRNATVYLRAAVMHNRRVIISMPRPAPIEIQRNIAWNLILTVDLPTLLVGQISMIGEKITLSGDYDAYVQIVVGGTEKVLSSTRVPFNGVWPQLFRVEVDNLYFVEHRFLEARAIVKNCKEEVILRSASETRIHSRLNLNLDLQIVARDMKALKKLTSDVKVEANVGEGFWAVSLHGTSSIDANHAVATLEASFNPSF